MSEWLEQDAEPAEETLEPETTGDETVDAVVLSLRGLDELPVSEHVAVFERAHESLRQVLSGAGEPAPATQS
jgi:hypothetical protein